MTPTSQGDRWVVSRVLAAARGVAAERGEFFLLRGNHVRQIQAFDFVGHPRGMVVAPDGRFLYVADMTGGGPGVRAFRVSASGLLTEFSTSSQGVAFQRPSHVAITPDGQHLMLLDLDVGGFLYRVQGSGELVLTDSTAFGQPAFAGKHILPPVFSEKIVFAVSGRYAYWHQPFGGGLVGVEVLANGTLMLVPGVPLPSNPILAALMNPDGTRILYEVSKSDVSIRLLEINADGSLTQRGQPVMIQAPPGYTPNGACVLYRGAKADFVLTSSIKCVFKCVIKGDQNG